MKKIIIGHTGLVGQTLLNNIKFDYKFNSSNIGEFDSVEDGCDLYLCCLPATKWQINQEPLLDYNNLYSIFKRLSAKSYSNIYLFSTIDVYSDSPLHVDENYPPPFSKLGYGCNRYTFELLIKELKSTQTQIIRLSGLFGKGLKKNLIFDLINNHRIEYINPNSKLQWYDLKDLYSDINLLPNTSGIYNLFPEPVLTKDIMDLFDITSSVSDPGVVYDYFTQHKDGGYWYDSTTSLNKIKNYINESIS